MKSVGIGGIDECPRLKKKMDSPSIHDYQQELENETVRRFDGGDSRIDDRRQGPTSYSLDARLGPRQRPDHESLEAAPSQVRWRRAPVRRVGAGDWCHYPLP